MALNHLVNRSRQLLSTIQGLPIRKAARPNLSKALVTDIIEGRDPLSSLQALRRERLAKHQAKLLQQRIDIELKEALKLSAKAVQATVLADEARLQGMAAENAALALDGGQWDPIAMSEMTLALYQQLTQGRGGAGNENDNPQGGAAPGAAAGAEEDEVEPMDDAGEGEGDAEAAQATGAAEAEAEAAPVAEAVPQPPLQTDIVPPVLQPLAPTDSVRLLPTLTLVKRDPVEAAKRFIAAFHMDTERQWGRENRVLKAAREVYQGLKDAGPRLETLTSDVLDSMERVAEGIIDQSRSPARYGFVPPQAVKAASKFLEYRTAFVAEDEDANSQVSFYSSASSEGRQRATRRMAGLTLAEGTTTSRPNTRSTMSA